MLLNSLFFLLLFRLGDTFLYVRFGYEGLLLLSSDVHLTLNIIHVFFEEFMGETIEVNRVINCFLNSDTLLLHLLILFYYIVLQAEHLFRGFLYYFSL